MSNIHLTKVSTLLTLLKELKDSAENVFVSALPTQIAQNIYYNNNNN